ncbi:TIR domain-containing protein [Roseibium sp.]|uniref:TIR domain-containing protein n=1 Tax=Roseibium sp. TaxID=1936156 RepID=UPI003265C70E
MANRTGTYFGFDGLGQTDPTKSDFRYYATVQSWASGKGIDFKFVNSHEKASAVRDTSRRATLEASIRQRLAASKNMVVILSGDTRKTGSMLSYEIEKAVDTYDLPLIIAHTGYNSILDPSALSNRWPNTLTTSINNATAKAIHIPFKKDAILDAISQFSVNGARLGGPLVHYTREAHVGWGYIL